MPRLNPCHVQDERKLIAPLPDTDEVLSQIVLHAQTTAVRLTEATVDMIDATKSVSDEKRTIESTAIVTNTFQDDISVSIFNRSFTGYIRQL
jgi:hypothetical protein